jgi:NAD-dependent deacetylase
MLPSGALEAASEAARGCDVFFSIGTSSLVYPAAGLPYEAVQADAVLVEINPHETPLSPYADYALRGSAGEVLPKLLREAFESATG